MAKGGDFETLLKLSNENNFRAKRNFEHIFEKYNRPFRDDVLDLSTMSIIHSKGHVEKLGRKTIGKSKLLSCSRKDKSLQLRDSALGCSEYTNTTIRNGAAISPTNHDSDRRSCGSSPHTVCSSPEDIKPNLTLLSVLSDVLVSESEPSDAETISSETSSDDDEEVSREAVSNGSKLSRRTLTSSQETLTSDDSGPALSPWRPSVKSETRKIKSKSIKRVIERSSDFARSSSAGNLSYSKDITSSDSAMVLSSVEPKLKAVSNVVTPKSNTQPVVKQEKVSPATVRNTAKSPRRILPTVICSGQAMLKVTNSTQICKPTEISTASFSSPGSSWIGPKTAVENAITRAVDIQSPFNQGRNILHNLQSNSHKDTSSASKIATQRESYCDRKFHSGRSVHQRKQSDSERHNTTYTILPNGGHHAMVDLKSRRRITPLLVDGHVDGSSSSTSGQKSRLSIHNAAAQTDTSTQKMSTDPKAVCRSVPAKFKSSFQDSQLDAEWKRMVLTSSKAHFTSVGSPLSRKIGQSPARNDRGAELSTRPEAFELHSPESRNTVNQGHTPVTPGNHHNLQDVLHRIKSRDIGQSRSSVEDTETHRKRVTHDDGSVTPKSKQTMQYVLDWMKSCAVENEALNDVDIPVRPASALPTCPVTPTYQGSLREQLQRMKSSANAKCKHTSNMHELECVKRLDRDAHRAASCVKTSSNTRKSAFEFMSNLNKDYNILQDSQTDNSGKDNFDRMRIGGNRLLDNNTCGSSKTAYVTDTSEVDASDADDVMESDAWLADGEMSDGDTECQIIDLSPGDVTIIDLDSTRSQKSENKRNYQTGQARNVFRRNENLYSNTSKVKGFSAIPHPPSELKSRSFVFSKKSSSKLDSCLNSHEEKASSNSSPRVEITKETPYARRGSSKSSFSSQDITLKNIRKPSNSSDSETEDCILIEEEQPRSVGHANRNYKRPVYDRPQMLESPSNRVNPVTCDVFSPKGQPVAGSGNDALFSPKTPRQTQHSECSKAPAVITPRRPCDSESPSVMFARLKMKSVEKQKKKEEPFPATNDPVTPINKLNEKKKATIFSPAAAFAKLKMKSPQIPCHYNPNSKKGVPLPGNETESADISTNNAQTRAFVPLQIGPGSSTKTPTHENKVNNDPMVLCQIQNLLPHEPGARIVSITKLADNVVKSPSAQIDQTTHSEDAVFKRPQFVSPNTFRPLRETKTTEHRSSLSKKRLFSESRQVICSTPTKGGNPMLDISFISAIDEPCNPKQNSTKQQYFQPIESTITLSTAPSTKITQSKDQFRKTEPLVPTTVKQRDHAFASSNNKSQFDGTKEANRDSRENIQVCKKGLQTSRDVAVAKTPSHLSSPSSESTVLYYYDANANSNSNSTNSTTTTLSGPIKENKHPLTHKAFLALKNRPRSEPAKNKIVATQHRDHSPKLISKDEESDIEIDDSNVSVFSSPRATDRYRDKRSASKSTEPSKSSPAICKTAATKVKSKSTEQNQREKSPFDRESEVRVPGRRGRPRKKGLTYKEYMGVLAREQDETRRYKVERYLRSSEPPDPLQGSPPHGSVFSPSHKISPLRTNQRQRDGQHGQGRNSQKMRNGDSPLRATPQAKTDKTPSRKHGYNLVRSQSVCSTKNPNETSFSSLNPEMFDTQLKNLKLCFRTESETPSRDSPRTLSKSIAGRQSDTTKRYHRVISRLKCSAFQNNLSNTPGEGVDNLRSNDLFQRRKRSSKRLRYDSTSDHESDDGANRRKRSRHMRSPKANTSSVSQQNTDKTGSKVIEIDDTTEIEQSGDCRLTSVNKWDMNKSTDISICGGPGTCNKSICFSCISN